MDGGMVDGWGDGWMGGWVRMTRQKTSKHTDLSNIINRLDRINIYRTCRPKTAEHTFSSRAHGTFSRTDHMLSC